MTLKFKEREIVVPGDLLAEGDYRSGEGTYKIKNQVFSSMVGLFDVRQNLVFIIPLKGKYIPREGDIVIGKIMDASMRAWKVNIYAPWLAVLSVTNAIEHRFDPVNNNTLSIFKVGDMILARVEAFDRATGIVLSILDRGLGKLRGGRLTEINPTKVPRLVGRRRSMISMIEKEIGCRLEIGQNGWIWISGKTLEDELLVENVVQTVEREAHTSGLTDRIREMIKLEIKKRDEKKDVKNDK